LRLLINAYHPGLLARIFSFGATAYTAIPNYGLFQDSTIPNSAQVRHFILSQIPLLSFIAASIMLAYVIV
jgi:hypothetical protein